MILLNKNDYIHIYQICHQKMIRDAMPPELDNQQFVAKCWCESVMEYLTLKKMI